MYILYMQKIMIKIRIPTRVTIATIVASTSFQNPHDGIILYIRMCIATYNIMYVRIYNIY